MAVKSKKELGTLAAKGYTLEVERKANEMETEANEMKRIAWAVETNALGKEHTYEFKCVYERIRIEIETAAKQGKMSTKCYSGPQSCADLVEKSLKEADFEVTYDGKSTIWVVAWGEDLDEELAVKVLQNE